MAPAPNIKPLPYRHRRYTFILLAILFVCSLPFLYLYATGYRFEFGKQTALVSTGGIIVGADRDGASMYVDGQEVRERRIFYKAFYADGLNPGTHRVYVQKTGSHTWVKELPVYPHLVTEAQAFNMPLVPDVTIYSPWKDANGTTVLFASSTLKASTTNPIRVATTTATRKLVADTEYKTLYALFATTTATTTSHTALTAGNVKSVSVATTSTSTTAATTTKEWQNVRLFKKGDDVYAQWFGARDNMPYYYCAEDYPRYSSSTATSSSAATTTKRLSAAAAAVAANDRELIGPVQTVDVHTMCDPTITMDRKGQTVKAFDFYPGSTDLVILALQDGVYVEEVDNRHWQNMQPLLMGNNLDMKVDDGTVYVFDGTLIYKVSTQ